MPHRPTLPYSLNENMEPIQQDGTFLELHKAAAFSANLEPLATLLKNFQRDNESPNTDVDKRAAALRMVNPSLELKQEMLQAIEVGGGALCSETHNSMPVSCHSIKSRSCLQSNKKYDRIISIATRTKAEHSTATTTVCQPPCCCTTRSCTCFTCTRSTTNCRTSTCTLTNYTTFPNTCACTITCI